jgi:catechol 2,3-dioxygenase-like lactoylglutathione lyase family enzyme
MTTRVHHSAICVADVEASLRFYREGLGLEVLMDQSFEGDWPTLFDARSNRLRSIFLGDAANPDAGIVELVSFGDGAEGRSPDPVPREGFFLLSFNVDVEETLDRMAQLGFADLRRIDQPAGALGTVPMAVLRDPDGVRIELIGSPSR